MYYHRQYSAIYNEGQGEFQSLAPLPRLASQALVYFVHVTFVLYYRNVIYKILLKLLNVNAQTLK